MSWLRQLHRALARVIPAVPAPRAVPIPPTIFRCGVCGDIAVRFNPDTGGRFRAPSDSEFSCRTHGPLADPSFAGWHAEWVRRGRPARLNWRLPPLC